MPDADLKPTVQYAAKQARLWKAEAERLREGIERLATGRCDCDVSYLGGHDFGCSSRVETVDRDDLWALLEHEEPFDG